MAEIAIPIIALGAFYIISNSDKNKENIIQESYENMNRNNKNNRNNYHLPSNYNYNTFNKINDMNNTAYIDIFCSYIYNSIIH